MPAAFAPTATPRDSEAGAGVASRTLATRCSNEAAGGHRELGSRPVLFSQSAGSGHEPGLPGRPAEHPCAISNESEQGAAFISAMSRAGYVLGQNLNP